MLNRIHTHQKGDTLIEVLFAITVFSIVAVGGLAIMNQGIATSERALEITLVRQEINAQSQALRFMHDGFVANYVSNGAAEGAYPDNTPAGQWAKMLSGMATTPIQTPTEFNNVTTCPSPPSGSFIIDAPAATVELAAGKLQSSQGSYSQVNYQTDKNGATTVTSANGIWIEALPSAVSADKNQTNAGYIDFHILACWDGPGQGPPVTIGTIVRLYEPLG